MKPLSPASRHIRAQIAAFWTTTFQSAELLGFTDLVAASSSEANSLKPYHRKLSVTWPHCTCFRSLTAPSTTDQGIGTLSIVSWLSPYTGCDTRPCDVVQA